MLKSCNPSRSLRMQQKYMTAVSEYFREDYGDSAEVRKPYGGTMGVAYGYGCKRSTLGVGAGMVAEQRLPTEERGLFFCFAKGMASTTVQRRYRGANCSDSDETSSAADLSDEASSDADLFDEVSSDEVEQQSMDESSEEDEEHSKSAIVDEIESPLDMAAKAVGSKNGRHPRGLAKRGLWVRIRKTFRANEKSSVDATIKKWIKEGNEFSRELMVGTIVDLKRNRKYRAALQVLEWVMNEKPFPITDLDYGYRVDLIATVYGLKKAEQFFMRIPDEYKSQMVYSIVLATYVRFNSLKQAERVFKKAEKLGLGGSTYMYNQLLLLHRRKGSTVQILELVKEMDKKNIEADLFTYNILLGLKARKGEVKAMENIISVMKEKKVKPDGAIYCVFAKGCVAAGLNEKAEQALHKAEHAIGKMSSNHTQYYLILELYAELGNYTEVERIWKTIVNSPNSYLDDYTKMIEALGKMGKVERAEQIFKEMWQSKGIGRVRQVNALLSVYANQGMVHEAEELAKSLEKESLSANFTTYHHLVKMHVNLGLEQKVIETLENLEQIIQTRNRFQSTQNRPLYPTFELILKMFSVKGDVANAERTISSLKTVGYKPSFNLYSMLLDTYVKAGVVPYGFSDRMQTDGNFPNEEIRNTLKRLRGT